VDGGGGLSIRYRYPDRYRRTRFNLDGHGMAPRLMTAQPTVTMRRWNTTVIGTLAAMAVLTALTTGAVAKQTRPGQGGGRATRGG
jgi:hypothetical protein